MQRPRCAGTGTNYSQAFWGTREQEHLEQGICQIIFSEQGNS